MGLHILYITGRPVFQTCLVILAVYDNGLFLVTRSKYFILYWNFIYASSKTKGLVDLSLPKKANIFISEKLYMGHNEI